MEPAHSGNPGKLSGAGFGISGIVSAHHVDTSHFHEEATLASSLVSCADQTGLATGHSDLVATSTSRAASEFDAAQPRPYSISNRSIF